MTLIEQIKAELEPHHVDGFSSLFYPAPSMDQIERLIAEVERLTAERDTQMPKVQRFHWSSEAMLANEHGYYVHYHKLRELEKAFNEVVQQRDKLATQARISCSVSA